MALNVFGALGNIKSESFMLYLVLFQAKSVFYHPMGKTVEVAGINTPDCWCDLHST